MLKELIGDFSRLEAQPVLVAGDLMLDTYTIGKARRISPEAPVAVIHVEREEFLPGGVGNSALNLQALGANPLLLGRVGTDAAGDALLKALKEAHLPTEQLIRSKKHKTPVKNRIVAENQQVVRVDHEELSPLPPEEEEEVLQKIPELVRSVKVIALSDYAKGFLTPRLLAALIAEAKKQDRFLIADPKGTDFSRYSGSSLLKPNVSEAYAAAKAPPETSLDEVAKSLLQLYDIEHLMITRSEAGISLFSKRGARKDFPVRAKQVKDVTGAGDTVLAALAFCIANALPLETAIHFANVAAGIAIERFGCAQVTLQELAKRLFELDSKNKVFDREHLHALKSALQGTPCKTIALEKGGFPDHKEIASLIQEKQVHGSALIACIKDSDPDPCWIAALSALQPIDYIVLDSSPNTTLL